MASRRENSSLQKRGAMDEIQSPCDEAGQLHLDLNLAAPDLPDFDLDGDTLREECGVFGIFGHPDAAAITALGLHALQQRAAPRARHATSCPAMPRAAIPATPPPAAPSCAMCSRCSPNSTPAALRS